MSRNSYVFADDEGNAITARTLAARMENFRREFPFTAGYSLRTESEISPIRLRNINGTELPSVKFTATVRLRSEIIADASTLQPIEGFKSFEIGESNARSRVLEVLGFGRELTDQDEAAQNAEFQARKHERPAGLATVSTLDAARDAAKSEVKATPATSVRSEERPAPQATSKQDGVSTGHFEDVKPVPRKPVTKVEESSPIPAHIRNQIEQRFKRDGKPVPELTSPEQATKLLKELLSGKSVP
jgi:hypothetical protein